MDIMGKQNAHSTPDVMFDIAPPIPLEVNPMDIKFHITTTNLGTVLLHLIDKNVNSATN